MADTYTTRNRIEKIEPGTRSGTWAAELNAAALDIIDQGMDGIANVTVSGPVTLSTANGATDQARCRYLNLSGTGGIVTIPNVEKSYLVRNSTSGTVTFTTGAGTTATIAAGAYAVIVCEGSNICRNLTKLLSASDITIGTLAVANGGTGSATSTGTGSVVLSNAPTFTGTITANVAGDPMSLNNTSGTTLINCSTAGLLKFRIGANGSEFMITDNSSNARFNVTTGGTPAIQLNQVQVLTTRRTGWSSPTGTATRTGFVTGSVTLPALAEAVKALIDDLVTHGLIGA